MPTERKQEAIRALLERLLKRPVCPPDPQAEDGLARQGYRCELGSQALCNRVYTAFYRHLAKHGIIERHLSDRPFALNDRAFVIGGDVTRHPRFIDALGEEGFRALIQGALEPRPNDELYDRTLQAVAEAAAHYASLKELFERIKQGSELA